VGLQLASGSGDATARLWSLPSGPSGKSRQCAPVVLPHLVGGSEAWRDVSKEASKDVSKDVTTLDWKHDGSLLATGSYDGQARVWSASGQLTQTLSRHKGPIFSLKWNRTGQFLLSGSVDKTAIVWDVGAGEVRQQFSFHTEPTLDVDWRDDTSFASCSTDRVIFVCALGEERRAPAGRSPFPPTWTWEVPSSPTPSNNLQQPSPLVSRPRPSNNPPRGARPAPLHLAPTPAALGPQVREAARGPR